MPPTLLLTRPEAQSRRFAASLPGLPVVISPIFDIVPVAHDAAVLARAEGLVFTSVHAVPAAGPGRGRLAYCVGGRTAEVAEAAGFRVIAGPGDAARLAPLVAAATVPLVHPRGRHVAADLGVPAVVVYDQPARPLDAAAQALLSGDAPVILPLFSPRSARLVGEAAAQARAPLWIAPISEAARLVWPGAPARSETAETPDAEGVRAAVIRLISREQS